MQALDQKTDLRLPKGKWWGGKIEIGINRYVPRYIKKINKNLLYSTENYIQYLVITYNGKVF